MTSTIEQFEQVPRTIPPRPIAAHVKKIQQLRRTTSENGFIQLDSIQHTNDGEYTLLETEPESATEKFLNWREQDLHIQKSRKKKRKTDKRAFNHLKIQVLNGGKRRPQTSKNQGRFIQIPEFISMFDQPPKKKKKEMVNNDWGLTTEFKTAVQRCSSAKNGIVKMYGL